MSRKAVSTSILMLLSICIITLAFSIQPVKSEPTTWIVDDDGPSDFDTIQEAIYAANAGDTIIISSGIYHENVIVNKTLNLIGENLQNTIIYGKRNQTILKMVKPNINITALTIQNGTEAIYLTNYASSCTIKKCKIASNNDGIYIRSNYNRIIKNIITKNNETGIKMLGCCGVRIRGTIVTENQLLDNLYGVVLGFCRDIMVYHNNFINNTCQATSYSGIDFAWDNGFEGNYWSDYNGSDCIPCIPCNSCIRDGIGDTPYVIDSYNSDHFPLMGRYNSFNISVGKHVNIVTNSTINAFEYELNGTICFYVSNSASNQSVGFCRVTIPKDVILPPYTVLINNGLVNVLSFNGMIEDNGTHRWIYFSYPHSTHEIIIIPEFPSFLILPLFMIATLLAVYYTEENQRQVKSETLTSFLLSIAKYLKQDVSSMKW